jgi:hypothetical protein
MMGRAPPALASLQVEESQKSSAASSATALMAGQRHDGMAGWTDRRRCTAAGLVEAQVEFAEGLDSLPDNFQDSATADASRPQRTSGNHSVTRLRKGLTARRYSGRLAPVGPQPPAMDYRHKPVRRGGQFWTPMRVNFNAD